MATVVYQGTRCARQQDESVLDALLRAGVEVPHSCKSGVCGSCLMRAAQDEPPPARAQAGLKDAWAAQGYFLACVCHPDGDLVAEPVGADVRVPVTIAALERLSASVMRVRVTPTADFTYRSGQFVTLVRADGLARSYSVASLPGEHALEFHVRVLPGGRMSQWLAHEAVAGEALHVQGPSGDCFYLGGREAQPLVLAGTGTGLAPLYGIARDALAQGHHGPVHLFHGAATADGLYLQPQLQQLAAAHPNFTYTATTLDTDGPIERTVLARHADLRGWRAFLCGDPAVVKTLQKRLFLAGAALTDIHADAFLPSAAA